MKNDEFKKNSFIINGNNHKNNNNYKIPLSFQNNYLNNDIQNNYNLDNANNKNNQYIQVINTPLQDYNNTSFQTYNYDSNKIVQTLNDENNNSYEIAYPNSEVEYNITTPRTDYNYNVYSNYDQIYKNIMKKENSDGKTKNINKYIFSQFLLINELEKKEMIQLLEMQKEKLADENKKLTKNLPILKKEKEKLAKEKKTFIKEKIKVIDDLKKKEDGLLKLEKDIHNKFIPMKQEIKDMKLKLKEEEAMLNNEKEKINIDFNSKINELHNDFKNKQRIQDENNNINLDRIRKEEEKLRQKEKEINDLKNKYMNINNNLDIKENELNNKEIELQNKAFNLNNKYNQLLEEEKKLSDKKNDILGNIQNEEMGFNKLAQDLKNREEQLKNKEFQLIHVEKTLKDKEDEIKTRENNISNRQNILNNKLYEQVSEINKKENELNDKLYELNDKEEHLKNLKKEIENKKNKIDELNNEYNNILENINSEKSKSNISYTKIDNNNNFQNKKKMQENSMDHLENKKDEDIQGNDFYQEMEENHFDKNNENIYDNNNINGLNDLINNNNNLNNEEEEEYYDFDDNSNNEEQMKNENDSNQNNNQNNFQIPADGIMPVKEEEIEKNENSLQYYDNLDNEQNPLGNNNINNNYNNNIKKNSSSVKDNIYKSIDTMNYNNKMQDIGEMDLNQLHDPDNNSNSIIANQKSNSIKDFNLDVIKEELFIEKYNPSLGLSKIDNPKYMNAVIQTLSHIPEITENIINLHIDPDYQNIYNNLIVAKAYREVLINLFLPEKALNLIKMPYNPKKFINLIKSLNPNFDNDNNNYKEFIEFLINKLHEELNTNRKQIRSDLIFNDQKSIQIKNENDALIDFLQNFTNKNNSVIVKNIYGIIKNTLYCHKCQNSYYNYYCYSYFNFNLQNIFEYKQSKNNKENITLDIYDCLDYYQKAETLLGDKAIFCPQCKEQNESTSLKNIYSTKNILVFIFENIKEYNSVQSYFDYSEIINLRDYVEIKKNSEKKSKEKFYLCGVVNFVEDNYGNEGFFAFCKIGKNNDWYCYDDENVYPVTLQEIKNNGFPVALFYHKLIRK